MPSSSIQFSPQLPQCQDPMICSISIGFPPYQSEKMSTSWFLAVYFDSQLAQESLGVSLTPCLYNEARHNVYSSLTSRHTETLIHGQQFEWQVWWSLPVPVSRLWRPRITKKIIRYLPVLSNMDGGQLFCKDFSKYINIQQYKTQLK